MEQIHGVKGAGQYVRRLMVRYLNKAFTLNTHQNERNTLGLTWHPLASYSYNRTNVLSGPNNPLTKKRVIPAKAGIQVINNPTQVGQHLGFARFAESFF
jgi:hypothetical protein